MDERRKKLHELKAILDNGIDSEAGLQRLSAAEARLRADITATQAHNLQTQRALADAGSSDWRRLQAAREAAGKRARKHDEQEAKAARLRAKLASLQVRPLEPLLHSGLHPSELSQHEGHRRAEGE